MPGTERSHFLATVADLYYIEGMCQAEIAARFGYTRSTISRLLTKARDQGIVEISINHPLERLANLEQKLRSHFDLIDACVVHRGTLNYLQTLRQIGKMGASFLNNQLHDGATLGISWGMAVHEVAQALQPRSRPGIQVVQMIGSLGYGDPLIDGPELARTIANILGAQFHTLNAPLIVDDQASRQVLLSERRIHETLEMALNADIALVGIGSVEVERSSLIRAGHITPAEIKIIKDGGAVGDICATHYDIFGNILDLDINNRVIGIDLESLRKSRCNVIGVAAGKVKAPAILGALRGGFLNTLITDSAAAEGLLSLHEH